MRHRPAGAAALPVLPSSPAACCEDAASAPAQAHHPLGRDVCAPCGPRNNRRVEGAPIFRPQLAPGPPCSHDSPAGRHPYSGRSKKTNFAVKYGKLLQLHFTRETYYIHVVSTMIQYSMETRMPRTSSAWSQVTQKEYLSHAEGVREVKSYRICTRFVTPRSKA